MEKMVIGKCMMNFGAPGEHHGSTRLLNTPSLEFCFGHDVPSLPEFKQFLRNLCFFSPTHRHDQEIPMVQLCRPIPCNHEKQLHEPPDGLGQF